MKKILGYRPLLALVFSTFLGASSYAGCGDDDEPEEYDPCSYYCVELRDEAQCTECHRMFELTQSPLDASTPSP